MNWNQRRLASIAPQIKGELEHIPARPQRLPTSREKMELDRLTMRVMIDIPRSQRPLLNVRSKDHEQLAR